MGLLEDDTTTSAESAEGGPSRRRASSRRSRFRPEATRTTGWSMRSPTEASESTARSRRCSRPRPPKERRPGRRS